MADNLIGATVAHFVSGNVSDLARNLAVRMVLHNRAAQLIPVGRRRQGSALKCQLAIGMVSLGPIALADRRYRQINVGRLSVPGVTGIVVVAPLFIPYPLGGLCQQR